MVYKESEKRRIGGQTYVPAYYASTMKQVEHTADSMRKDNWNIRIIVTHPKIDGKRKALYTLYTLYGGKPKEKRRK